MSDSESAGDADHPAAREPATAPRTDLTGHGEARRPAPGVGPPPAPGVAHAGPPGQEASGGDSYYGLPVLKEPVWEALDIAGYLFLGGLAGASSLLAAGAELGDRPGLARVTKLGALGAISLSLVALIHDLGRPARFLNMLRVLKVTSPMSVGTWILTGYAPLVGLAAASELSGRVPRVGRAATLGAAGLGPAVASYTAALVANTAVPVWHDAYRELPFVFVASAATAAAGLGMICAPVAEAGPARRLALLGAAGELVAEQLMERRMGAVAEPLRHGRAGGLMRASRVLTMLGAGLGAIAAGRSRSAATLAGGALLAASACTRFGIFAAGMVSARDPRYTVGPQRERLGAQRPAARR